MKKALLIATTLVVGILIGAVLMGSVLAAPPAPGATPTPVTPGVCPSGDCGQYGRGGMMGGQRGGMMGLGMDRGIEQEALDLLRMTREQVIAERQAGKSLVQIAQAKGVTEQQLVNTILAAKRADLDALVSQGKLTQAQADAMYQNMQQTVPQAVNRTTTGPGRPTMPGRGGMRGGRWG